MTVEITWEDTAERKREALAAYLAPWAPVQKAAKPVSSDNVLSYPTAVLSEQDTTITEMGVGDLVEALKAGRLSSVNVTVCRRRHDWTIELTRSKPSFDVRQLPTAWSTASTKPSTSRLW
jgi:hypothetical protein